MGSQRREWALTADALDRLLAFLDPNPERAAAEYERLRQRLMKLFRWRGCLAFEEYTDITLDRVARMIASGVEIHTSNRYALFHGVAINVVREHWRDVERQRQALDLRPPPSGPPHAEELAVRGEADLLSEARLECLRTCLAALPAASRSLIRRYYAAGDVLNKDQRKRLADEFRLSPSALRVRAHRIRAEVGRSVERCLERRGVKRSWDLDD